jgi:outer membrane protein TolC
MCIKHLRYAGIFALLMGDSAFSQAETPLTLDHAVSLAQSADPWLDRSRHRQKAATAQSIAAGALPDPVVSLNIANLPLDSFDFGQEPMTQLKVQASQTFPRGDTRKLKRRRLHEQGEQQPLMRKDRLANVDVTVSQLWLEAFRHRETIRLIKGDRALFEHLVDIAESNYTSGVVRTQQHDLVRAQLELTRLEDRLVLAQQQQEATLAALSEWLPNMAPQAISLSEILPTMTDDQHVQALGGLSKILLSHPKIKTIDQQLAMTRTGIELARQQHKPQWKLNTGYGYRDDDPLGNDRSDFFSLGVSFDVPLFPAHRQDQKVRSAQAIDAALKTEKALALRSMRASYQSARSRLQHLNQRKTLYEQRLLKEVHDQAQASLTAYTNDAGDFAEAVRARIAELNANIDFLNIKIDRLLAITQLNYFLPPAKGRSEGATLG